MKGCDYMSLQRTKGIIIRSIDYKDSSKVITLFSEKFGKIPLMAHGAKRIANTINASYETGNLVDVVMYKKTDTELMGTISQISIINQFKKIKMDLAKTAMAQYCMDFVYKNTEDYDENKAFYKVLLSFLELINDRKVSMKMKACWDYNALKLIGVEPNIWECIICGKRIDEGLWIAEEGGISCGCEHNKGFPLKKEDLQTLRLLSNKFPLDENEENRININVITAIDEMLKHHSNVPTSHLTFLNTVL